MEKKDIMGDINKLEEQLKKLDNEEEADLLREKKEGGALQNMEDFNIRDIITDGWWRLIVAFFGVMIIYKLVIDTVAGVEVVLAGTPPEEEGAEGAPEDALADPDAEAAEQDPGT